VSNEEAVIEEAAQFFKSSLHEKTYQDLNKETKQ